MSVKHECGDGGGVKKEADDKNGSTSAPRLVPSLLQSGLRLLPPPGTVE